MNRLNAICVFAGCATMGVAVLRPAPPAPQDYEKEILPLLTKYCSPCHAGKTGPGEFGIQSNKKMADVVANRDRWQRIAGALSKEIMPPPGNPEPTEAERAKIVAFIGSALAADCDVRNPGRVTIRRLNREEYNNTVRDLLGVDFRPAADFPSDEVGYGFDNIGDVLSMSPLLMEKYLQAAQQVAERAIYTPGEKTVRITGDQILIPLSGVVEDGGRMLYTTSELAAPFDLPAAGKYKIRVRAYQTKAGPEDARMSIRLDGKELQQFAVSAERGKPQTFEVEAAAPEGKVKFGAAFTNDFVEADGTAQRRDRNLVVMFIEVQGPLGPPDKLPASHLRLVPAVPTRDKWLTTERQTLAALASRAYRRPATKAEVDKLVKIAELAHKNGEPYEKCLQLGITAMLVSPNFLFRVEPDEGKKERLLNSYEIASRLSYFLWSSMPDDELFAAAARNDLQKPLLLQAQVLRMLKSPKAEALADNFAGQWLQLRKLAAANPDRKQFPQFTEELRRAMATETKLFFQHIVSEDRSILEFINGEYSYLNEPLAKLYGIDGITGKQFRRVELTGGTRAGVITQASVLTVTSNPTRTSPVKRGKWILENILNAAPPPPPPNTGVLKDDKASTDALTIRERLEMHRKAPECSPCHVQMDSLGFSLENFDPVGGWRTKDGRFDVDASGELPDGSKFTGPAQMRDVLMKRKKEFVRALAAKLLTYALGRGLETYDECAIDEIEKTVVANDYRFSALVTAVAASEPFLKRKAQ